MKMADFIEKILFVYLASQKSVAKSSTSFRMKPLNFVNLPGPYCICFVKMGEILRKMGDFSYKKLQNKWYTPLHSSAASPVSSMVFGQFLLFLVKNAEKVAVKPRFLLKTDELYEFLCICSGSKGVFWYGLFLLLVKPGELGYFSMFTGEKDRPQPPLCEGKRRKEDKKETPATRGQETQRKILFVGGSYV